MASISAAYATATWTSIGCHLYPFVKSSKDRHYFPSIPMRPLIGNSPQSLLPILSRRLFLPSVSGIWDAITGNNNPRDSILAIRRGMILFRQGDVLGSLAEFDKAIELDPRQEAYLWQRGLSLYYLDRFEEGAKQFRLDVAQNPNDTEESIWCFLCEAQLYGFNDARKLFLEMLQFWKILSSNDSGQPTLRWIFNVDWLNHEAHNIIDYFLVGLDPRPVMREAYNMFKNGGDPEKLVALFSNGRENEVFYASLYAGLYHESQNNPKLAKFHLLAACTCSYGQRSDDYMASLAKVHIHCRNWSTE